MPIEKSDAVLLKKRNLRESSLVLTFCTKDFGKVSGVIKGVRGPRAAMGASPMLFSLNRIVFYESRKRKLNTISHCDLLDFFDLIRKDFQRTVYAEYFLELVDSLSAEFDKNEEVFKLLVDSLRLLCTSASAKRIARIFEIRFMNLLGLMPELVSCYNCGAKSPEGSRFSLRLGGLICRNCFAKDRSAVDVSKGTINFIEHIKKVSYERASRIKVAKIVGTELENILRKFVDYHLENRLKTIEFMKKVGL